MARAGMNCHQRENVFAGRFLCSLDQPEHVDDAVARLEGTLSPWVACPRSFFADTVRTNRIGLGNQQERVAAERGDAG